MNHLSHSLQEFMAVLISPGFAHEGSLLARRGAPHVRHPKKLAWTLEPPGWPWMAVDGCYHQSEVRKVEDHMRFDMRMYMIKREDGML